MTLLLSVLEQGLIYAILALGVYITFKILDFPDMSVDSSFPLGAAVTALMIAGGCSPLLTLPVSLLAGAAAGALTGFIHVRLKVRDLLAGIIVMTALYSVNLHIAGRANVQLFTFNTIFKNERIASLPAGLQPYAPVLILDEATSSIDTRTERLIEKGMDRLMAGRTVFVIAHRLSTVRNSDAIMVLEHGQIVERGDHDDLLAQKGKYYQLYMGMFELS